MPFKDGILASREIRQLPLPQAKILLFGCTADVFKDTDIKCFLQGR